MSVGHSPRTAKSSQRVGLDRIDPRTWSLWTASRPFLCYALVVDALAVAVIVATVPVVPVGIHDLVVLAGLALASVVHLELMRGIERLRELHSVGHVYTDLKSIWTFAGLLLLPPPLLAALIVLTFVHSWFRLGRRPVVHRWVFSCCNVVLASAAGASILMAAEPDTYPSLPTGWLALGVIVAVALARWLVNRTLTSVALVLMRGGRMSVRMAYGPASDNLIESGALGLGVLAAVLVVHVPALVPILVVPVVVVHRGLLLTQFEHAAHRDAVTGLHNAGFWSELASKILERAQARQTNVALLLVHLDDLEAIERRHGRDVADAVLRQVADLMRGRARGDDLLGRLPGHDFAVLLPEITGSEVTQLVDHLRASVRTVRSAGSDAGELTLSVGVATYPDNASTLDELMRAADLALIAAQTYSRDQARYSQITPLPSTTT